MTDLNLSPLAEKPRLFRVGVARGVTGKVVRDGGDFGAGIIHGAAMITRGEAQTHGFWVDGDMVSKTAGLVNAAEHGVKSRFAHPSLSGDGLGKALGRFRDAVVDGDLARGDLHLYETAHKTPDGNLADYVMDLAVEDPEAFGTSIAFDPDIGEEDRFRAEHTDKDGRFNSPDPANVNDLQHARIATLSAVDMVDEPAANPEGLFHQGDEVSFAADALLAYALGLTDECPAAAFGIHPDRVRQFVERFLSRHKLNIGAIRVTPIEEFMSTVIRAAWRASARARELEIDHE